MDKKGLFRNKLYILLIVGISVFLLGCLQPPATQTQYVCSNGTVVTDQTLCPAPATQYVCSDGTIVTDQTLCPTEAAEPDLLPLTLEQELEVCIGMPLLPQASLEDMCIIGIAAKHEDLSVCTKISRDQRPACYGVIGMVKSDPDICLEAAPEEDKCYEQYALNKRDGSICGKITNVGTKNNCYNNLANQLGDPTLCEGIQSLNQKDNCYLNMAHRFNDSSYCDSIIDGGQKEQCFRELGKESK